MSSNAECLGSLIDVTMTFTIFDVKIDRKNIVTSFSNTHSRFFSSSFWSLGKRSSYTEWRPSPLEVSLECLSQSYLLPLPPLVKENEKGVGRRHDNKQNDIQHYDTPNNGTQHCDIQDFSKLTHFHCHSLQRS